MSTAAKKMNIFIVNNNQHRNQNPITIYSKTFSWATPSNKEKHEKEDQLQRSTESRPTTQIIQIIHLFWAATRHFVTNQTPDKTSLKAITYSDPTKHIIAQQMRGERLLECADHALPSIKSSTD